MLTSEGKDREWEAVYSFDWKPVYTSVLAEPVITPAASSTKTYKVLVQLPMVTTWFPMKRGCHGILKNLPVKGLTNH